MPSDLPRLFLVRHGDTAWTESRQHTGRTDLPLTERGSSRAQQLGSVLRKIHFARVYTSPLQRASKTCELAGYGAVARRDDRLVEWDYGQFEGLRTDEILKQQPGWELFHHGCPGGESPTEVAARADSFVGEVKALTGDVLAFSSGHIGRMIAARWLGLTPEAGRYFYCRPASIGILGFEHHNLEEPVISLWNHEVEGLM